MSVIACTYFDGKSSLARRASVIIARRQVQLVGHDVAQSYDARRVRLSEPIGTTPRWIYLPDGGACWVAESGSLSHFARDSRLNRVVHQWESRPALAALALGLVVALVWALIQFGVPAGARFVAERIPESAETRLGVETLAGLDKQWMTPTKLSAARQQALRAKFDKMVEAGGAATNAVGNGAAGGGTLGDAVGKPGGSAAVRLEFRASKIIGPNAFALPGGIMVMTDELVALAKHDNEILGVLAHELGHLRERHAMRGLLESSAVALLIAGITGDIASTASLAASAPVLLLQNKFSRGNETEADQFAFALMQKASIDPKHFAIMIGRLEEKSEGGAFIPAFLSSHPATEARKALALEASRAKPMEQQQDNSPEPASESDARRNAAMPAANAQQEEIVALVTRADLDGLEASLSKYQNDFETGAIGPGSLERAFYAFSKLPTAAEATLSAWIAKYPASYAAYTARAQFYLEQGLRARGVRYAGLTPPEDMALMRQMHAKAIADLEASQTLTAKPYLTHRHRMMIAHVGGGRAGVRSHYLEALKLAPGSVNTRLAYLDSLEPRWGGSISAMEKYIEESKAELTDPKEIALLQARLPAYQGFLAREAKNLVEVERQFSAALALHDNATWRCERAYALTTMNRNMDAFADVQRALTLDPHDAYCRELGSSIAAKLARSAKSASDAEEGLRMLTLLIDQGFGNADALNQRGYRYQEQGKLDLAFADYLASAKLDDGWGQLMTGKCLWAGRGTPQNRDEAMVWLKKAADKGDRDAVVSYQQAQDALRTAKK